MEFYRQVIFPRLCHLALRAPRIRPLRRQVLEGLYGIVLELGVGTGLNLRWYPQAVRYLVGIDPNRGMLRLATRQAPALPRGTSNWLSLLPNTFPSRPEAATACYPPSRSAVSIPSPPHFGKCAEC